MRAFAKRRFTYNGIVLEPGEVFEMIGARNDSKLVGLKYCEEIKRKGDVLNCTCGKSFAGEAVEAYLRGHQASDKHPKEPIILSARA